MNNYYALLMAGGIGERFKPLSTPDFPKQFHDLLGKGRSLLQISYDRFSKIVDADRILIATNERYQPLVNNQISGIKKEQILLETAKRNTAPCILYAALKIFQRDPDGILFVSPTDHFINNELEFKQNLLQAAQFCTTNDALVTLGIAANEPNTEYGYINFVQSENAVKQVIQFVEKPSKSRAIEFLKDGGYLWNSGLFIFGVRNILNAFREHQAVLFEAFNVDMNFWDQKAEGLFLKSKYPMAENMSIDYAIMEKASNVAVLPATFEWSDIGSWRSLYDILPKDENGKAQVQNYEIEIDQNKHLLVYSNGNTVLKLNI